MPARLSSMELSPASNPDAESSVRPSRRKSGRVTKATEFLASHGQARSRTTDGDVDMDAESGSNDDDNDDDDDENDEADEEELKEQRRRKRKAAPAKKPAPAKKSKPNGTASTTLAIRPAAPARSKRAKVPKKGAIAAAAEVGGLYGEVFAGEETLDIVAAHWLQRFEEDEAVAMTDLVNFILRCTGCTITVEQNDILDVDNIHVRLQDIQDEFQAQNIVDYPLIAKDKTANAFRQSMTTFFNYLVQSMSAKGLLGESDELMSNISTWVSIMTSATSRPFRHTAIVISLEIVSALSDLARALIDSEARSRRQAESEQKGKKSNKGRVSDFNQSAVQAAKDRKAIDARIGEWFNTVYVYRYRDVDPRIRADCVGYLTDWVMTYPEHFLDGSHLRYLGWMLSDTAASTRHEVVKQLQKVFKDDSKLGGLRQFTERFRARMVEMATRDGELNVRCSAIELLDVLRDKGLLEPDDIDTVGKLMFDVDQRVRKAVTPFFVASVQDSYQARLDDFDAEDLANYQPDEDEAGIDTPRTDWLLYKSLAELMQSYDSDEDAPILDPGTSFMDDVTTHIHSRVSLAAEAVYENLPALSNWEALAGYLLVDNSTTVDTESGDLALLIRGASKLDEKEEAILLDVLNVSVKRNLAAVVEQTSGKKQKLSKTQQRELHETQEAAAQVLATLIPRLLTKFGSAPETASAVLRLEHVLNLSIFQELRQDNSTYSELLKKINDQFMSHDSSNVIGEAKMALLHAKSFEDLKEVTEGKLEALWEDTLFSVGRLLHPVRDQLSRRCNLDPSHLAQLSSALLRMENLSSISDSSVWLEPARPIVGNKKDKKSAAWNTSMLDILVSLVSRGTKQAQREGDVPRSMLNDTELNDTEDALVGYCLRIVMFYYMWKVSALRSSASGVASQKNINGILTTRGQVFEAIHAIIRSRRGAEPLRVNAAGVLLEISTLFLTLKQVSGRATELTKLGEDGQASLPLKHRRAVLRVFKVTERDYARKSGKSIWSETDKLRGDGNSDDEDEAGPGDDALNADPETSSDEGAADYETTVDDDRAAVQALRKQRVELLAEQALCSLAGKMVLAIAGGAFHAPDEGSGSANTEAVKERMHFNGPRLGPNYRGVLNMLDGADESGASAAKKTRRGGLKKAPARSAEVVEDDEDDEPAPVEDGDENDLRARGLLVDDAAEEGVADEGDVDAASIVGD